ncbi:SAM-dependent DNA methyltransferase [Spirosoma sp. KCTC 42546]|uniref:type I restriction-modification system subunit M n=1 Tax=Spirosoma sp. KCTC 42546 TaxID=2520506 RepID=UPI001158B1CF|nr:class I SAM-dependent DNA methyltransferase [Spirosoma sp. KCTC 42546]QDK79688.1 SAM-dependent DNA methyltransferase [Spirosoma sp. KCTC 42546]
MLQNSDIKQLIKQLWNKFWSGGISNPITAIEQITYLLFMRRLDEDDAERMTNDETYVSIFPRQELRWFYFKDMPGDKLLSHIQTDVFPFLKTLSPADSPFAEHMKNAVFIIPKPSLMVDAVKIIDEIYIKITHDSAVDGRGHSVQDIQGDVYEYLLSEIASAGKNGQFRTPRHIINLIVELVQPQFGASIADPACGTGGFLVAAYIYILTQFTSDAYRKKDEDGFIRGTKADKLIDYTRKSSWEHDCFHGFDIDQTMVRMGLMNLMMHGFSNPQIKYQDTLSRGYNEDSRYDFVLANPPFTGNINKEDINDGLLQMVDTRKTEILFIAGIYRMLSVGGTAAIIVPQGVLFSSSKAFVEARKIIVDDCELKAVITMPSGVFKPYAGVSTAILIFTKGGTTTQTWFYEMLADGRTLDDKRAKLDSYGDLQAIVTLYRERTSKPPKGRKGRCFVVPKSELVDNSYDLSLSKYKEDDYVSTEYKTPSLILSELRTLETEIMAGLSELEGFLK